MVTIERVGALVNRGAVRLKGRCSWGWPPRARDGDGQVSRWSDSGHDDQGEWGNLLDEPEVPLVSRKHDGADLAAGQGNEAVVH